MFLLSSILITLSSSYLASGVSENEFQIEIPSLQSCVIFLKLYEFKRKMSWESQDIHNAVIQSNNKGERTLWVLWSRFSGAKDVTRPNYRFYEACSIQILIERTIGNIKKVSELDFYAAIYDTSNRAYEELNADLVSNHYYAFPYFSHSNVIILTFRKLDEITGNNADKFPISPEALDMTIYIHPIEETMSKSFPTYELCVACPPENKYRLRNPIESLLNVGKTKNVGKLNTTGYRYRLRAQDNDAWMNVEDTFRCKMGPKNLTNKSKCGLKDYLTVAIGESMNYEEKPFHYQKGYVELVYRSSNADDNKMRNLWFLEHTFGSLHYCDFSVKRHQSVSFSVWLSPFSHSTWFALKSVLIIVAIFQLILGIFNNITSPKNDNSIRGFVLSYTKNFCYWLFFLVCISLRQENQLRTFLMLIFNFSALLISNVYENTITSELIIQEEPQIFRNLAELIDSGYNISWDTSRLPDPQFQQVMHLFGNYYAPPIAYERAFKDTWITWYEQEYRRLRKNTPFPHESVVTYYTYQLVDENWQSLFGNPSKKLAGSQFSTPTGHLKKTIKLSQLVTDYKCMAASENFGRGMFTAEMKGYGAKQVQTYVTRFRDFGLLDIWNKTDMRNWVGTQLHLDDGHPENKWKVENLLDFLQPKHDPGLISVLNLLPVVTVHCIFLALAAFIVVCELVFRRNVRNAVRKGWMCLKLGICGLMFKVSFGKCGKINIDTT